MPAQKRDLGPIEASPNLSGIPSEILNQIVSHLDSPSAAALGRLGHRFAAATGLKVWTHLRLATPVKYGLQPLIEPAENAYPEFRRRWVDAEDVRAEQRRRAVLKTKIQRVLEGCTKARAKMVQTMSTTPSPGSVVGLSEVINRVAKHLTRLEVEGTRYVWVYPNSTLDKQLMDTSKSFPALTHVRITRYAIGHSHFLTHLCEKAPNLIFLDVDVDHPIEGGEMYDSDGSDWAENTSPHKRMAKTKLRHLRVCFGDRTPDDASAATLHPAADIIFSSPHLQQLAVEYSGYDHEFHSFLGTYIATLPELRELEWGISAEHLCHLLPAIADEKGFSALRRLMLRAGREERFVPDGHLDLLETLPTIPSLEAIYVSARYPVMLVDNDFTERSIFADRQTILPSFSAAVRAMPHLSILHYIDEAVDRQPSDLFAHLDSISEPNGRVSSVIHADTELISINLFSHCWQHSDHPTFTPRPNPLEDVQYTTSDGEHRARRFGRSAKKAWMRMLDYDAEPVPIEVWDRMMEAEGIGADEGIGRGREVGHEAWSILMAWKDSKGE